ncbi:hypothetical protein QP110_03385 [Aerococcus sp. UMB10185]|uniref:hypothetical protein n=1 Tax=unclassified Aerococcus TaxID=2618060 RepID=UPI0008A54B42|nr:MULTISPECIES: hypothetical protein [unclassified Aerococcus]MDK6233301.1 hypothetical protein [Aerococcus sp. UMB10185]MDK6855129.1 hypothetical protein [Aerococcus sp. UMB7533]MDK8501955.1 hypothetical protein [Aerococcus sp. UMB1112A]OFN04467.1 hypothetical protein HMPREF2626_00305 [Aerococcus sp. HMSC062A02]OHO42956.1 hypothetical protein HMPREF2705_02355 [Aerococcus sp. HMSC035B07]
MHRFNRYLGAGDKEAGYNLSWGAIFAGVVTFIALMITLGFIGNAIGFGTVSPKASDPMSGVGTGVLIWTVIQLILSFLGAGFVSGITARRVGVVHGFLTWAVSTIATFILLSVATVSILSSVGTFFGQVAQTAGQSLESVTSSAADSVSNGVNALTDQIDVNQSDIQSLENDVNDVLRDTNIKELQPEYLKGQLQGASDDISQAAKDLVTNPENSDAIFDQLSNQLQARTESITENVDEQAVANAIESNSDLSQAEAEQTTQNIVEGYNRAASEARQQIDQASQALDQTKSEAQDAIAQLRNEANKASDTTAQASIWAFVGLLLGAILSALGGYFGTKFVTEEANENHI